MPATTPASFRAFKYDRRIFTVVNPSPVEWLPGNVVVDPENSLDLRDLRKALWAVGRAPEMAYMLRSSHAESRFFSRLVIDKGKSLPIVEVDGIWTVQEALRASWSRLEGSLLYIWGILSAKTARLPEARFPDPDPYWALPQDMGYMGRHKSRSAVVHALWKLRDAMFLLAARCSMAIALSNFLPNTSQGSLASVPPWQRILMQAGANSTWIDELNQSLISDLSPGLRVGAFICPTHGDMFTEWINHVPCMIKANLPVYIYWPTYSDDYAVVWDKIVAEFPCLRPYRPSSVDVPEVPLSNEEHLARDRHGRPYVVNPQNSFRWDQLPGAVSDRISIAPAADASPQEVTENIPHGQGQRSGESFEQFRARQAAQVETLEKKETADARQ
ncbi:hypothetical protein C8Q79DRAFT_1005879 [Trametes meyenii]|nr:hypothetical protein C8Q79DRAFT_1005879 [Trametes meyenii]